MANPYGETAAKQFVPEPADDNWKHRSSKMSCRTCMWFVEKKAELQKGRDVPPVFGRCRKHAPTLGGWPAVFGADWCGDHKLDENRL